MSVLFPEEKNIYVFGPEDAGKTSFVIQLYNYIQLSVAPNSSIMRDLKEIHMKVSHDEIATRSKDILDIKERIKITVYSAGGGKDTDTVGHRKDLIFQAAGSIDNSIIYLFELGRINSRYYCDEIESSLRYLLTAFNNYGTLRGRKFLFLANKAEVTYRQNGPDGIENLLEIANDILGDIFQDFGLDFAKEKSSKNILLVPSSTIIGALEIPVFFRKLGKDINIIMKGYDFLYIGEEPKKRIINSILDIAKDDAEISARLDIIKDKDVWEYCKQAVKKCISAFIEFIYGPDVLQHHKKIIDDFARWFDKNLHSLISQTQK